jgi:serine/threonine-protein kinase RsbT
VIVINSETIQIKTEQDTVFLRNRIAEYAGKIKMGLVNQTKLLTASSELVRNMLRYAGGGIVHCEVVSQSILQKGIRLTFMDRGPGIANIAEAMKDGFSTGKSLGLGLPGAKRLVNLFEISSQVGQGTKIMILKWING